MSTASPATAPAWRKSPWDLTPREHQIADCWRDPKRLRSDLEWVNTTRMIWNLCSIPFGLFGVFVIGASLVDIAARIGGLGHIVDSSIMDHANWVIGCAILLGCIHQFQGRQMAALKFIGQLEERIEALEKSFHE